MLRGAAAAGGVVGAVLVGWRVGSGSRGGGSRVCMYVVLTTERPHAAHNTCASMYIVPYERTLCQSPTPQHPKGKTHPIKSSSVLYFPLSDARRVGPCGPSSDCRTTSHFLPPAPLPAAPPFFFAGLPCSSLRTRRASESVKLPYLFVVGVVGG